MKLPIFAGLALLGAALATVAHAQLVHIAATSDNLYGELVGYPQASRPMAGTAKLDLYYDASVVGTDGIFTFNDPTKNYWTLAAAFNPYETDPNAPLTEVRNFSFPLETMKFAPATENSLPGAFALTSPPSTGGNRFFDFGLMLSGPPTSLPVPPITFSTNFNYFYVVFSDSEVPFDGGSIFGAGLHNFSAEIITPIPEPSIYGIGAAIAALCCIVYHRRRRALMVAV